MALLYSWKSNETSEESTENITESDRNLLQLLLIILHYQT